MITTAEPISLAAGIVELTNTGFSLGKFLNETCLSYKNAPTEVLEIAHDVIVKTTTSAKGGLTTLKSPSQHPKSHFAEIREGFGGYFY